MQFHNSCDNIKTKAVRVEINIGLFNDNQSMILIDCSLTVKLATLIFISGRGSAISSAIQGKSGSIYNFVKNK